MRNGSGWRLGLVGVGLLLCLTAGLRAEDKAATPAPAQTTEDPLKKANAYSLELAADMTPGEGFFPLGILSDRNFEILAPMGFTLSDLGAHTCYEFREGKPCTYEYRGVDRGAYFTNCWAAHSLYNSRETKTHGLLKTAMKDDGTEHGRHMIRILDPQTRKYVLDCEAHTVKTMVERGVGQTYLWGIDNEWETPLDYSPEAKTAFCDWLKKTYADDLGKLNLAWDTKYAAFADAVPPMTTEYRTRPGAWLDWRAFQEEVYTDFIAERFKTVTGNDPLHRPVVSKSTQCTIEMTAVAKKKVNNHEMLAAKTRAYSQGWLGIDMYGHGDRNAYEFTYLHNCILPDDPSVKGKVGIFTGETNNHSGPGWQFAQTYWRSLACGLKGANFFCMGYFGAKNDWATFSFLDANDGSPLGRMYYASRLGAMIHRSEAFWARTVPAGGTRIAMLLPFRDIQLAENTGVSLWDYPKNNRLQVFKWLRDQGYWVEPIGYGKLNPAFMAKYKALVLVDSEHLSAGECENVRQFVKNGGVLLADTRPGYFDEHHLLTRGLDDVIGVEPGGFDLGIDLSPDDLYYNLTDGSVLRADGRVKAELKTAELVNREQVARNQKEAWVTRNVLGKGTAFWFNTRLGVVRPETSDDAALSAWLAGFLKSAGVVPDMASSAGADAFRQLRVEQPMVDESGNCVLLVAGAETTKPVAAQSLTVTLPGDFGATAFWSAAESAGLEPVKVTREKDNRYTFELPEVMTAGVVYLFPKHTPLVGIKPEKVERSADVDAWTPLVKPTERVTLTVQAANPSAKAVSGTLRVAAPQGWTVEPSEIAVPKLAAGEIKSFPVTVTLPEQNDELVANKLYSVVARWNDGVKDTGICHTPVKVLPDAAKASFLLSDNPGSHESQRFMVIPTKMRYTYRLSPEEKDKNAVCDPSNDKDGTKDDAALVNGLRNWDRVVQFRGKDAEVVFDLKQPFLVTEVRVARAPSTPPTGLAVSCALTEDAFPKTEMADPGWANNTNASEWVTLPLNGVSARYVSLHIAFPNGGGFLDEVEIYGRPLPEKK